MDIKITIPRDFNFRRTVLSHGWCALRPFEFEKTKWILTRVLALPNAAPITVQISATRNHLKVITSRSVGKRAAETITRDVRHMFRLDEDLTPFYQAMYANPEFEWIRSEGAGRLLRAPTVFEDLVKMVCTTNCSWALTEVMVNQLVRTLGRKAGDGRYSFPAPEAMAGKPESFYRRVIRAGYRAPYLKELARKVASGE